MRVVLVAAMPGREAAGARRDEVLQTHPRDGVELEGPEHAIGLSHPWVACYFRLAHNVHPDVVGRGVVHAPVDAGDVDEVRPDAALPPARERHDGLAARLLR